MTKPDWLIIGAQRSGTSSLYQYLLKHPKIEGPRDKEVHFFDARYSRGLDWYQTQFSANPELKSGEATPIYMFYPPALERIAEHLPDVKLIVLLRDPVTRAYSHYNFYHSQDPYAKRYPQSWTTAIELGLYRARKEHVYRTQGYYPDWTMYNRNSYLARGLYHLQLRDVFDAFPKENVLIQGAESFFANPALTVGVCFEFLGVDAYEIHEFETYMSCDYEPMEPDLEETLVNFYVPTRRTLREIFDLSSIVLQWKRRE